MQRVTPIVIATPTCHRPIIRLLSEQLFYGQLTRPFPSLAVGWVWLRETTVAPLIAPLCYNIYYNTHSKCSTRGI